MEGRKERRKNGGRRRKKGKERKEKCQMEGWIDEWRNGWFIHLRGQPK